MTSNSLYLAVRTHNPAIGVAIEDHFQASGMIEFELMPLTEDLPRGSLTGTVVNVGSSPIDMVHLVVRAIGEHGDHEPDGGVAYGVAADGTFTIPRLAAMGWEVSIIYSDPAGGDPRSIGSARVVVVGGQMARVTIPIDSGG